jgi:hypothetical protein
MVKDICVINEAGIKLLLRKVLGKTGLSRSSIRPNIKEVSKTIAELSMESDADGRLNI